MQTESAARQLEPRKIIDIERFRAEEKASIHSALVLLVVDTLKSSGLQRASICDIGGGSGVLVREIADQSPCETDLAVLDVLDYGVTLKDGVSLMNSSILENKLNDNEFDIVIFRHLLHHLVGANIQNTLTLQERALHEMLRIVKPGGHLIFEEEVNRVKLFSRIVYHLSKLANNFNLKNSYFQAGISVVSFMTEEEIVDSLGRASDQWETQILKRFYTPWNMSLRWRLTLLMSRVGSFFSVIRKS